MTPRSTVEPSTFTERYIPRGEYRICVHEYAGADPTFVLMHGFPDNLRIYDRLAPLLADSGQRVIAFDFLGYGASDKPANQPYNANTMEADLQAVVAAAGAEKLIPVAHDASGPTAIEWSLDHADRVAALALLNTYYGASPTLKFPEFISLFADPAYRALSAAFISDPVQFGWLLTVQGQQFLQHEPAAGRASVQELLQSIVRGQFAATPSAVPAFASLTRELPALLEEHGRRAPKLSEFRRPVSLIWGASDPYLNTGVAQHLASLFPHAQLTLLDLGHWPQIDGAEDVAKPLLALCNLVRTR